MRRISLALGLIAGLAPPASASNVVFPILWNTTDNAGAVSNPYSIPNSAGTGAPGSVVPVAHLIGAFGSNAPYVPPGLPATFGIGLESGNTTLSWMTGSGVPWGYRYAYLNTGWQSFNSPSGQFAQIFTADSVQNSYVPVFTENEIQGTTFPVTNGCGTFTTNMLYIQNACNMAAYYADMASLFQKVNNWNLWDIAVNASGRLTGAADNTSITYTGTTGTDSIAQGKAFEASGKWTARFTVAKVVTASHMEIGFGNSSTPIGAYVGLNTNSFGVKGDGTGVLLNDVLICTSVLSTGYATGDVLDEVIDIPNLELWVRKNGGNWNGSSSNNPDTNVGGCALTGLSVGSGLAPVGDLWTNTDQITAQFTANLGLVTFKPWAANYNNTAILHVEPDLFGFAQQNNGDNPANTTVSVASSGYAGLGALPNTIAGFAQALVVLRNQYAPSLLIGWDISSWGPNNGFYATAQNVSAIATGDRSAAFYTDLKVHLDLLILDPSDADSAYKSHYCGTLYNNNCTCVYYTSSGCTSASIPVWWDPAAYARWRTWVSEIYLQTRMPSMQWQVPMGNTLYLAQNNTDYHYQDNQVEHFFAYGNINNVLDYLSAGTIGLLFGWGQAKDTDVYNNSASGTQNNPTTISDNYLATSTTKTETSPYTDDDGSFLRLAAAEYYTGNPVGIATGAIKFRRAFNILPAQGSGSNLTTWWLNPSDGNGPLTLTSGGPWTVTPLDRFSATVTAWGPGGASGGVAATSCTTSPSGGTATTFSGLTANAGANSPNATSSTGGVATSGGTASGGDTNTSGTNGGLPTIATTSIGGTGGNGANGGTGPAGGSAGNGVSTAGVVGVAPGSGAGGAAHGSNTSTSRRGTVGGAGGGQAIKAYAVGALTPGTAVTATLGTLAATSTGCDEAQGAQGAAGEIKIQ